ncbi:general substrate transporter [Dipodascopsis tothii]|uniref:general substrate transporter n=1 Tax=Dipodascopsis tothii TaxID=44089 RepID=UPI0034CD5EED
MGRAVNVYTISAFAALGGGLFGFDISSMSGVLATDQYKNYFNNPLGLQQGAITSSMAAGSVVGAIISSPLGEKLSRKHAIQLAALLWILGAAVQSAANGVPMLVTGRIVCGLCVGVTSSLVPVYQAELAPRQIRGRLVTLQQWAITWGIMIQFFVQYGCSYIPSTASFRVPWGVQIVPAVILLAALFFFPKSPRWLANKDHWDEALRVLAYLRTPNCDVDDPLVLAEFKEIEDQIRWERENSTNSYYELFRGRLLRRSVLALSIQMWSQFCGINVLLYYIVYVLEGAGVTNTLMSSSIQYVINVVMTVPAMMWSDRWGRRPPLIIGSFLMAVFFFTIAAVYKIYGEPTSDVDRAYTWMIYDNMPASRAVVALSYLTVATYAMSWGPISWMYPPEIMPLRLRSKAMSIASAGNWATNYMLGFGVPPLFRVISWRMFLIFGVLNVLACVHVFFAFPETKQRTLEEMNLIFEPGPPLWKKFMTREDPHRSKIDSTARDIELGNIKLHRSVEVEMYDYSSDQY